jgi:CRP/FNR family transcriptional regulator, cyclic AMP receptor protein
MRRLLEASAIPFDTAEYARGAAIFRQGDASEDVLHIEDGHVLLAVSTRTGKQAICGVLATGAFLGEETLIGHLVRRHSAIALTCTRVLVIAKADWLGRLQSQPALTDRFIEYLLTRETRLVEDLTDQLLHPAEQRLARTLLVLAGCDVRRPCRSMLPDISQELIAEIVGTTRSRVNAFIGKFKRVGFLEEDDGRLFVCTSRLATVCGASRGAASAASAAVSPAVRPKSSAGVSVG